MHILRSDALLVRAFVPVARASRRATRSVHHDAAALAGVHEAPTPALGQALPIMTRTGCLYLDYNATTPIFPEARAPHTHNVPPFFSRCQNPSTAKNIKHVPPRGLERIVPACFNLMDYLTQVAQAMSPFLFEHFG